MKKLFLSIILICLIPFHAHAIMPGLMQIWGDGGCDTSSIVWWSRNEAADFSGTNGTLDYSANDDTGTAGGSPVVGTGAVKYGTNGFDFNGAWDAYTYDTPSATLDENFNVGFWWRCVAYIDNSHLFRIYGDGNNYFFIDMNGSEGAATRELRIKWAVGGVEQVDVTTDVDLALNTWYWIEADGNTTGNTLNLFIDNVSVIADTTDIDPFAVAVATIIWGNVTAGAADFHEDNTIISTDSTDDFYPFCKDKLEWPE